MKRLRQLVRAFAAAVLWLHALFILPLRLPSITWLAEHLHLRSGETTVLLLLASLSVLASYGWKNLSLDSLYIYFFPFIVIFKVVRFGFVRVVGGKDQTQQRTAIVVQDVKPRSSAQMVSARLPWSRQLGSWMLRPFVGFTTLWGVLIVLASQQLFVWIALGIVSAHLVRAVIRSLRLAIRSHGWLNELDKKVVSYAEGIISTIMTASENADETTLKNAVLMLGGLHASVGILKNRRTVTQLLIAASLIVFGCVYLYLALLFSFVYYGLARIESITFSWPDALVTSMFIPALIGDLPRDVWIRLVGGIQWFLVVIGGVGSVIGYMQRRLNAVYAAVDTLGDRLADSELDQRFKTLSEKYKVNQPPAQSNTM